MKRKLLLVPLFLLYGCGDLENTGGVLTSNQLPQSVYKFIEGEDILSNEKIVAYYDLTISLDNSESAILTNKNVIYYKWGRVEKIALSSIKSIREVDCFGTCILITDINEKLMKIDIAPLNGGPLFLELLKNSKQPTGAV